MTESDPTQPGPEHEALLRRAGTYATEQRFWLTPESEPLVTAGEARLESILGGRFLREENTGMSAGRPVERLKVWGYDNAVQQYVAVWMYTQDTGILSLSGKSVDGGRTIEYTGTLQQAPGAAQTLYVSIQDTDDGGFVVEVGSIDAEGRKNRVEETTYTRRG